ncbi:NADP-specific glutamate dehydrogenase [Notoacmeibacter sp. MSK16QG-6]|uniref:NADP-specific glutamate dehydrogenase n=1 Tax=Notoacmeibacter sp. MSK16QG-6 TaxID=2957982 RepID=UPI0020A0629F|nr:NADP-specific glutamate dehydrogenase [Notoacmeibacter sp. MSK16QG-6]MCP1198873.1 NADP-specific glutamate dehydrogenase [Notoacmeibacter sp. MSK16QG-6]
MSKAVDDYVNDFMKGLEKRNPAETEFHQAVHEVVCSVAPIYLDREDWVRDQLLERLTEPDRVVSFRVPWETDDGMIRANRAWRVQFNHAIGPYKGGLRFSETVTESVLKFLGFEQTLKNALTGLPMGGAKGGSNFNPKGKSEREIMRFCQSLMNELQRHIGEDIDVPAGDIGVSSREISYLFGQYVKVNNRWAGVLTGKGSCFGGSAMRTEATGWGVVYFLRAMLQRIGEDIEGRTFCISGAGNVALHAAEKVLDLDGTVLSLSDSTGTLYFKDGLRQDDVEAIQRLKDHGGSLGDHDGNGTFRKGKTPWSIKCDVALPCATQNEMGEQDAKALIENGVKAIVEGANMPLTADAVERVRKAKILYAPGKASNAGGVAVSGLEQTQNAMRMSWSGEEVDSRLVSIMEEMHGRCLEHGMKDGYVDYVDGANIAAFLKVAAAVKSYGVW